MYRDKDKCDYKIGDALIQHPYYFYFSSCLPSDSQDTQWGHILGKFNA